MSLEFLALLFQDKRVEKNILRAVLFKKNHKIKTKTYPQPLSIGKTFKEKKIQIDINDILI
jgi:hypothetical protein